ncbi:DUF262 domain-containing HNH endonuclease family protein [Vitreoscilla massiliensis]|uniref:DUF262 domain-containing HNH endonuclease family protein n=1 Tax=Vitreoscilla massiliensis TaxID=1689272 RepID=A0ABY4DYV1_9NEIS|nr:DUF262 domain-containing protein [Vitreoscilla massiliensis]UOO88296.1 DUF262 domain-containing HNH endonuclease family protein [Vitreoscilla massiliensis]
MQNNQQSIQTLSVDSLLNHDQYIIPIYQRNYAWGNDEIEALINDINHAMARDAQSQYYIGSLVVFKRDDGQFEVIDGQQRLTTLGILSAYLQQLDHLQADIKALLPLERNTGFEYRADSEHAFNHLFSTTADLPSNFQAAIQAFKKHWPENDEQSQERARFLLHKVHIIRTEVPPQTDLNHYFEIMNTRGEQLAKHEVLKARLMSRLAAQDCSSHEQSAFAAIWDACSDMNRYMVLGFPSDSRKNIFGDAWQRLPQDFDAISTALTQQDEHTERKSILEVIQGKHINQVSAATEASGRFNPVIDFPNLLMHVFKIFNHDAHLDIDARAIALDEKTLLESFAVLVQKDADEIKRFAMALCQCRFLFDKYIIKADTSKQQDDHWSLATIKPYNKHSYQYHNAFADNKRVELLLSMFHVSHPSRIYKNWLYAVLKWLYDSPARTHLNTELDAESYIAFLEDLSDRYYFGHYGAGTDFFDLINQASFVRPTYPSDEVMSEKLQNMLNSGGTAIPNFIFNRLDYLLWQKEGQDFRFTFRNSVEHFYPQNPPDEIFKLADDEDLHCLGNLCLISQSHNSRFSNNMPKAKKANFINTEHNSLKLQIMMQEADTWDKASIRNHHQAMINVLNQP